jgi:hypothetical protein
MRLPVVASRLNLVADQSLGAVGGCRLVHRTDDVAGIETEALSRSVELSHRLVGGGEHYDIAAVAPVLPPTGNDLAPSIGGGAGFVDAAVLAVVVEGGDVAMA